MGKENQQQIPQDFENLFHQRKNGRFCFPTKKIPAMLILQNNNILQPCLSKIDLFLKRLAFWQPKKRAAKKVGTKTDILKEPPCCRAGRWSTLTKKNRSDLGVTILIYRLSPAPQFFPRKKPNSKKAPNLH